MKYVRAMGEASEAGVVAGHFRTSVLNAAFANGTMASALGYDDFGYMVAALLRYCYRRFYPWRKN